MKGTFRLVLSGLTVFLLAACATTPQHRYASSVKAAQIADRPLVVYGLSGAYGWQLGPPQQFSAAYYVGVAFINSDAAPLQKLAFRLTASFDYKPVLNADGTPLQIDLNAKGLFAPGGGAAIVASLSPTQAESDALGGACLHLDSIQITYQDHRTFTVAAPMASAYLVPQIKPRAICAHYAPRPRTPPRVILPPYPLWQAYQPFHLQSGTITN